MKMIPYEKVRKEFLKDPEFKKAYDALQPEFDLAAAIIQKRIDKKMTQAALAKKMGTKQSAISRLESGDSNPSFVFLKKVAKGLDSKLKISFS
jgi:ribosome-binding protein aMBF1 (putative translation factor)